MSRARWPLTQALVTLLVDGPDDPALTAAGYLAERSAVALQA
jgi:hypothetical protein